LNFTDFLALLRDGGPWTMLAVSGYAIRYLFLELRAANAKHEETAQRLNDRIIATVEKTQQLLDGSAEVNRKLLAALQGGDQDGRRDV